MTDKTRECKRSKQAAHLDLRGLEGAAAFVGGASPSAAHAQASQEPLRALGFVPAALGQGECRWVQQAHQLGVAWPGRCGDHISNGNGSCLRAQRPVHAAVVQAIQLYLFCVSRRYLQQQHI